MAALVVVVPLTVDRLQLTDAEFQEAVQLAGTMIGTGVGVDADRIRVEVEAQLGRDVVVDDVTEAVLDKLFPPDDDGSTTWYEVSTVPRYDRVDDNVPDPDDSFADPLPDDYEYRDLVEDAPTACVEVDSRTTELGVGIKVATRSGRCD